PLLARQQRGEAYAWRGQAVAPQDPLDGALAGQRADAQGLQLGPDGGRPGQAVAGRRRGGGPPPAGGGGDGPLPRGRGPVGGGGRGGWRGAGRKGVGAGLQVAVSPLVEPALGAADGGAGGLDSSAGEAQGNSAVASRGSSFMGTSAWRPLTVARGGGSTPTRA